MIIYKEMKKYYRKIKKTEINNYIQPDSALILFASFESRSITLANQIDPMKIVKSFTFRNEDPPMAKEIIKNYDIIYERLQCDEKVISLGAPDKTADAIYLTISEIIQKEIKNIIVDISTFTHEALLILLRTIKVFQSSFDHIHLVYNGASRYAEWLSKGCKDIRNVISYPGLFNPAYKNHMIILTGFEKERATQLVELFEPDILSIGNGNEPTHQNHTRTMKKMRKEFNEWFSNLGVPYIPFEFSCRDIMSTMKTVLSMLNNPNENYYLVPLNSKLSTIAAAFVAFKDPRVQIVYPIPEIYNSEDYATPSESFTIINLKTLFQLTECSE